MPLITPNLRRKDRWTYVVLGVVLMAAAWLAPFSRTVAFVTGLLGFISVGEGLVGF